MFFLAGGRDTTGISRPTKRAPVGADAVGDARLRTCSRFVSCEPVALASLEMTPNLVVLFLLLSTCSAGLQPGTLASNLLAMTSDLVAWCRFLLARLTY